MYDIKKSIARKSCNFGRVIYLSDFVDVNEPNLIFYYSPLICYYGPALDVITARNTLISMLSKKD